MEGVFIPLHQNKPLGLIIPESPERPLDSPDPAPESRHQGPENSGFNSPARPTLVSFGHSEYLFGYSAYFQRNHPKCHSECIVINHQNQKICKESTFNDIMTLREQLRLFINEVKNNPMFAICHDNGDLAIKMIKAKMNQNLDWFFAYSVSLDFL